MIEAIEVRAGSFLYIDLHDGVEVNAVEGGNEVKFSRRSGPLPTGGTRARSRAHREFGDDERINLGRKFVPNLWVSAKESMNIQKLICKILLREKGQRDFLKVLLEV